MSRPVPQVILFLLSSQGFLCLGFAVLPTTLSIVVLCQVSPHRPVSEAARVSCCATNQLASRQSDCDLASKTQGGPSWQKQPMCVVVLYVGRRNRHRHSQAEVFVIADVPLPASSCRFSPPCNSYLPASCASPNGTLTDGRNQIQRRRSCHRRIRLPPPP